MSAKPKAIFFDLDETLIHNRIPISDLLASMYFDFQDTLGKHNEKIFLATLGQHAAQLWSDMFTRDLSPEKQLIDCFSKAIQSADVNAAITRNNELAENMFEHFLSLSSNNVTFNHGALDTLAELSNRGYITGLITNGIEQIQLGKIRKLNLHNKVDYVTVSAQAKAHKPSQPVFDLALSRAGIKPHQAWQVGDHATNDVAGAIRSGMSGIFYDPDNRVEQAFTDLPEQPTHTISHLAELLALL